MKAGICPNCGGVLKRGRKCGCLEPSNGHREAADRKGRCTVCGRRPVTAAAFLIMPEEGSSATDPKAAAMMCQECRLEYAREMQKAEKAAVQVW